MKACSKCGAEKPRSEFYRHSGSRDGLKGYCKPCGRSASSVYYRDHAAEQNAKTKARYFADPSRKAAYDRGYRARNREQRRDNERQRAAHLRGTGWRRRYTAAQKQATRLRDERRYEINSTTIKQRTAAYRRTHPTKHAAWGEAYRAKRRNAGSGVAAHQWLALCAAFGDRCLSCGVGGRVTMDHVLPLSAGGRHDLWNVQPLCKSCNSRKSRRHIDYRPAGWEQLVAELAARDRRSSRKLD